MAQKAEHEQKKEALKSSAEDFLNEVFVWERTTSRSEGGAKNIWTITRQGVYLSQIIKGPGFPLARE